MGWKQIGRPSRLSLWIVLALLLVSSQAAPAAAQAPAAQAPAAQAPVLQADAGKADAGKPAGESFKKKFQEFNELTGSEAMQGALKSFLEDKDGAKRFLKESAPLVKEKKEKMSYNG